MTRGDYAVALSVGLAALSVYALCIGPTVTGEDSGELITAAYTLGVPHPPGYPVWCLLGKLFSIVIPYGTIAWRVGFMVAFLGAATVGIMCLIGIRFTGNRAASAGAALVFAFSYQFWKQSVIAEMYTLNAVVTVACLLILFAWREHRDMRLLFLFGAVFGVGLCNHHTMYFTGPLFVLFILMVDREPWMRWKTYVAVGGVISLVWLCGQLYLPIRAASNPPINWGNPSSWESFWDVVMRQQYVFGFAKDPRTAGRFVQQLWVFVKQYGGEFTPWLALLPVLGIYPLWRRDWRFVAITLGGCAYMTLGFIVIINFNVDRESVWVNSKFWIPSYLMAALLMASGLDWALAPLFHRRGWKWCAGAFCLALPCLPLSANHYWVDKSHYYFADDYGRNLLKSLEPNAVFFPAADHATFPILYLQAVEGLRPDVTVANKYGYTEENLYAGMPPELHARIGKIPNDRDQRIIEDWIIANSGRPVYFTRKRDLSGLPGYKMVNAGLVYRVKRAGDAMDARDPWSEYVWHTLDRSEARREFTAEAVLADYHFFYARHLLEKGNKSEGLQHLQEVLDIGGETKELLNNIASTCAESGEFDKAIGYFARALEIDPDYTVGLMNLAGVYMQQGVHEKAIRPLEDLLHKKPDHFDARWALVECLKSVSQFDAAMENLKFLQHFFPNDARVYREMGFVCLSATRDYQKAQPFFTRSLQINPAQEDLRALMARGAEPAGTPQDADPLSGMPQEPQPGLGAFGPPLPEIPQPPIEGDQSP